MSRRFVAKIILAILILGMALGHAIGQMVFPPDSPVENLGQDSILRFKTAEAGEGPIVSKTIEVKAGGKVIRANVVIVRMSTPGIKVMVALGQDRVGGAEDLLDLARRKRAVAAINGTFFNAYVKGPIKDPVGTIITGGKLVHKGATGTVFAITAAKETRMEPVRFKIIGSTNGSHKWPNNWYAHSINRTPTGQDSAVIYTPERGKSAEVRDGISIVVRDGRIASVKPGAAAIPEDGYLINLRGNEEKLSERFQVGAPVEYEVCFSDGSPISDFWARAQEGIGAGPRLVADGKIIYSAQSAKAEGFTEAKILSASYARSGLGITGKKELLLVTVPAATMAELAQVMKALGATDAMNLDGGASSGLVFRGKYITEPGRDISNALIIMDFEAPSGNPAVPPGRAVK